VRTRALVSALLVAATFLVFFEVREHRFVDFDDLAGIVENPDLRVASPLEAVQTAFRTRLLGNWIPLTVLSLQADRALYGENPAGYLLTNVALHAASAVLLFVALARLTGGLWAAAFVAAVFAFHPLHVESVAWASMRKDSLSALFWMLTLLAYARYVERPAAGRYAWVVAGLILGLLAKPVLVTLPFVLLLLDYWPLRRLRGKQELRRALLEKLPLLMLVAIVCAVTLAVQKEAAALPDVARLPLDLRLWNAIDAYVTYLAKSIWPSGLAIFYPHPVNALPGTRVALEGLLLAALTAAALRMARSRPYLLLGWFWYLGTLVPMIGLVQVGNQARADRYMYLPLIGLSIAMAWGAADLLGRRRAGRTVLAAAGAALLVALGGAAAAQVTHWRDAVAVHKRAVAVTHDNPLEQHRLGNALRMEDRLEEALIHYERSIELEPRRWEPYFGLADLYSRTERLEEAVATYQRALELQPQHPRGYANLGLALVRLRRYAEARPHLERALELHGMSGPKQDPPPPELAVPHIALAHLLSNEGRVEQAIAHYETALAIDEERVGAAESLGMLLAQAGRFAEAQPYLERALAANRDSARLRASMGMTFAALGRPKDAIRHYRRALAFEPGWRLAANDLAWILATSADPTQRDPDEAIRLVEGVLLEQETLAALLDTLAAAYAAAGRFVRTAERALSLSAGASESAGAMRERLALYRSGRPYVEPVRQAGGAANRRGQALGSSPRGVR
jgi:tetratricopeptide (TPR) repeat protein